MFTVKEITKNEWCFINEKGINEFNKTFMFCDKFSDNYAVVKLNTNEYNYIDIHGNLVLENNVYTCYKFTNKMGKVKFADNTFNILLSNKTFLLKTNVSNCIISVYNNRAYISINNESYYIDSTGNMFNSDIISFKDLYNEYPTKRKELIDIISKYTYLYPEEYFT